MKNLLMCIALVILSTTLYAQQDYYWVGGSGDWSDYANHWATTSGGSEFHTSAPDETNNVIFDENSFDAEGVITFLNHAVCRTFDASAIDETVDWEEFNNGLRLIVHGSLLLSDLARIGLTTIEMEADNAGHAIDAAGTTLTNLHFDGEGSWELLSALNASVLRINESGTIATNNYNIHLGTEFIVQIPRGIGGTLPEGDELILGSSVIQAPKWEVNGTLLLDAGTSKIVVEEFYPGSVGEGSPIDYNDLELSGENGFIFRDANFNKMEVLAGSTIEIVAGSTITVNTLILDGTETDSITIKSKSFSPEGRASATSEDAATFQVSSGEVNGSYLSLTNIHGTGGATFNAYASKDHGGNDGWNFLKFDQIIIFDPLPVKTLGDEDFELMATGGGSGNPITYTSSNESVANISGSTVSIVGVGKAIITATQLGNDAYKDASATQELQVVERPLGVKESTLKIYPNPTQDILKVWLDLENDFQVTIIGLDGKEISHHNRLEAVSGIKIEHLESGVYIIEVATEKHQTIKSRLIVEK